MKQLEAAGLIEVAATRMVSGIWKQRYRARQRDRMLSEALSGGNRRDRDGRPSRLDAFLTGVFDRVRQVDWLSEGPNKPVMLVAEERVSPEASERIRTWVLAL